MIYEDTFSEISSCSNKYKVHYSAIYAAGSYMKGHIHLFYRNIKNLKLHIIYFSHTHLKSVTEHRACTLLSSILFTNTLNSYICARSNTDICQQEGKVVAVMFLLVPEWRTCWSCCGWRCCSSFQTGGSRTTKEPWVGSSTKLRIILFHYYITWMCSVDDGEELNGTQTRLYSSPFISEAVLKTSVARIFMLISYTSTSCSNYITEED